MALYDATGGASWTRNDYWKTAAPIGSWFGVTTGTDGRVLNLWLQSNQLSGPIPAQLGNLTSLTSLALDTDTGLCLAQDFPLTSPFATLAQARSPSIPVCTATGETPTISIVGPSTVTEGSAVLFVLTRGGGDQTQALTVNVSVTETGTMLLGTPPMTATFATNATTTTMVSIPTDDDTTVEGDSTVTVTLTAATGSPTTQLARLRPPRSP